LPNQDSYVQKSIIQIQTVRDLYYQVFLLTIVGLYFRYPGLCLFPDVHSTSSSLYSQLVHPYIRHQSTYSTRYRCLTTRTG